MNNLKKKISIAFLLLAVLIGTFSGGFYFGQNKASALANFSDRSLAYSDTNTDDKSLKNGTISLSDEVDFNLYWSVWQHLKDEYVDKNKVVDKDLFYGSLKGLAESLGDPYTIFMDPKETEEFNSDLSGTFEGIGAEVGMRNEVVTIIAPLAETPAAKAGLMPGDKILAVDAKTTVGLSVDEVVKKIRGPKDTTVVLTIMRGQEKPKDFSIVRGVIKVKSVTWEIRKDKLMVIKVSSFNNDTETLFAQAVQEALTKNPKGIIIDLRNNPGGYLETAINLSGYWVEPYQIVVAEQLNNNRRTEHVSRGSAVLAKVPTVVLVNGGSASASEILAGALRDYKLATLVGENTFGKGSVQSLETFTDGSSLKVTIAKWLTPAGDLINEKGLKPNIEIKMTASDIEKNLDPQLNKAVQLLLKKK